MGENFGPIFQRLWTKVYEVLGQCMGPRVVSNVFTRLSISCFIPRIWTVKVAVKLQSRKTPEIGGLEPLIIKDMGYPKFWTCIVKSHLLPNMWLVLVEFRSVSSEGS